MKTNIIIKKKSAEVVKPLSAVRHIVKLKFILRRHRCALDGCGQFFRNAEERDVHEKEVIHCPRCSWGSSYPMGSGNVVKYCEACLMSMDNSSKGAFKC